MGTITRELEALERLHGEFDFRDLELAQALNTSEPTLDRGRRGTGGEPTPVYLKRLEALEAYRVNSESAHVKSKARLRMASLRGLVRAGCHSTARHTP